jgi:hypothetical protein
MNITVYGISAVFILFSLSNMVADPDLWGLMAFGRLFWETGTFPFRDVYTYVPSITPWIYHEWLTGILYYLIYKYTGLAGLMVLRYFLAGITCGIIYITARLRGATSIQAIGVFGITSMGIFGVGFSPIRAQIFTYLFFIIYLYVLEKARVTERWETLLILPVIMILWCNLHGGFLAGLGVIAFFIVGGVTMRRSFLPYVLVFAVSGLVTLINPYGLEYWRYLLDAVMMPRPEVSEWAPLFQISKTHLPSWTIAYFLLIMAMSAVLVVRSRSMDVSALSCIVATLIMGLLHARHIVFFLITVSAYIPGLFNLKGTQFPNILMTNFKKKSISIASISALALILIFALPNLSNVKPFTMRIPSGPDKIDKAFYYPVGAMEYIKRQGYSGNILTLFEWGEYLMWNLHPHCRIALDGRYETVYPKHISDSYFDFYNATHKWNVFLLEYPPDMILIKKTSKVRLFLDRSPMWKLEFEDKGSTMFVRCDFFERSP